VKAQSLSQPQGDTTHDKTQAWRGDLSDSEFEAIFLMHYERVMAILARLLGERTRAEEVANEVFWKLYNQPPSSKTWHNVGGWLYRTATHAGIDALRAASRRKQYEHAAGLHAREQRPRGPEPLEEVLRAEDCGRVRSVLSSMRLPQAQLLLMRASGCSYKELAEALGVSAGGIGTLLNRAEAEFRKRYLKISKHKENV
jgi:RNA polymerase sigma factor (sigma-70 family)